MFSMLILLLINTYSPIKSTYFQKEYVDADLTFNPKRAVDISWLVEASYYSTTDGNKMNEILYTHGWKELIDNDKLLQFRGLNTDTIGFMGVVNGSTIIISFQGTNFEDIKQVKDDIEYTLIPFIEISPDLLVNKGFLQSWDDVKTTIYDYISTLSKIDKFLISGHSLGSAISTICAASLSKTFPKTSIVLYTFASPRVGDVKFVKYFNTKNFDEEGVSITHHRIRNGGDIITFLPPLLFSYKHTNDQILLMNDTCFYDNNEPTVSYDVMDYIYNHRLNTYRLLLSNFTSCYFQ